VSGKALGFGVAFALTAASAGAGAGARAQSPATEERAFGIEAEMLYGFTLVDAPKWARFTGLNEENKQMMGVIGRVFFLHLGRMRAGVEIGGQQLFSYEVETLGASGPERHKIHVDPLHFAVTGRTTPNPRLDLDFGLGFYFSENISRPGLHFGASYRVVDRRRFSVSGGARIATVMDQSVSAWPLALKVGGAWR
jgi:hypothetical protein